MSQVKQLKNILRTKKTNKDTKASYLKFSQNSALKDFLIATQNKELIVMLFVILLRLKVLIIISVQLVIRS